MEISKLIAQCDGFQWDKGNLEKNCKKYDVQVLEAEEVFRSNPAIFKKDEKHSHAEERYNALGLTSHGRELFISFTVRNSKIRVISARPMSDKERKEYEQGI